MNLADQPDTCPSSPAAVGRYPSSGDGKPGDRR